MRPARRRRTARRTPSCPGTRPTRLDRGLRHQQLGAEDVRLALEGAIGVLREVLRPAVRDRVVGRLLRVADPMPQLVGDRKAVAATRGLAAHRLGRVDDDQPLGRDQHPRALPQLGSLDPQAEQVLGDRLDRYRDLLAAVDGEMTVAELVGAWVAIPGWNWRQMPLTVIGFRDVSRLKESPAVRAGLTVDPGIRTTGNRPIAFMRTDGAAPTPAIP